MLVCQSNASEIGDNISECGTLAEALGSAIDETIISTIFEISGDAHNIIPQLACAGDSNRIKRHKAYTPSHSRGKS